MHGTSYVKMQIFSEFLLKRRGTESTTIVDYGSKDVSGSYKALFGCPNWKYIGVDMVQGKNVDVVLKNPYDWKEIETSSVDAFVSGQAFEHTEYVWLTMLEVERVLKPGGLACIIAPSAGEEHRYPVDCWRIYPDGFRTLAKFAKLDVLHVSTDWDPSSVGDGSEDWKDTLFMGAKPTTGASTELDKIREVLKLHVGKIPLPTGPQTASNDELAAFGP